MTNKNVRGPHINWAELAPTIRELASQGATLRALAGACHVSYSSMTRVIEPPNNITGEQNNTSPAAIAARIAYHQGRAIYHTNLALNETTPVWKNQ